MKKLYSLILFVIITTLVSCVGKITPDPNPEPDPDPPTAIEYQIKSFSLLKQNNPSLGRDIKFENISGNKFCAHLDGVTNATSLIATFELENGKFLIGDVAQESGKTANDFTKVVHYRFKQDDGKIVECSMTLVPYTGYPLLFITTEDEKIPGNKVDWKKASIKIVDIDGDYDCDKMDMEIRLRGNSTIAYPKKPFNIKLSQKKSMLGMPKNKRWSLLANYRDRSLLRNTVAFHIGQNLSKLEWTPKSHFVEMIFDGVYLGNYEFTEQIRVDENRINIDEMTAADIEGEKLTGGYLLEMDKRYDEVNKFKTAILSMPISIKEPDEDVFQKQHLKYITDYVNHIEKLMIDSDFQSAYDGYMDINSFIDCWFAYEIPANTEISGQYSCYFYKKRNGKLFAGPIWDYDYAFNFTSSPHAKGNPWFSLLLNDPIFLEAAKKRFNEVKPFLLTVPNFIESQREKMRLSNIQNETLWAPREGYIGNKDENMSYDESIDYLIDFYTKQVIWLEKYLN